MESSFYLSYYANMQPSEIDRLTTYEFNTYVDLLTKQIQTDRDYDMKIAGISKLNNIMHM